MRSLTPHPLHSYNYSSDPYWPISYAVVSLALAIPTTAKVDSLALHDCDIAIFVMRCCLIFSCSNKFWFICADCYYYYSWFDFFFSSISNYNIAQRHILRVYRQMKESKTCSILYRNVSIVGCRGCGDGSVRLASYLFFVLFCHPAQHQNDIITERKCLSCRNRTASADEQIGLIKYFRFRCLFCWIQRCLCSGGKYIHGVGVVQYRNGWSVSHSF